MIASMGFCISGECCFLCGKELGGEPKTVIIGKKKNEKENNKLVRLHLSTYLCQAVEMSNI